MERFNENQPQQKLGLALSGGGFRASFFHIGVLAQLARQRLLRHVEVISTVSGGSIIGAYYYLYVKQLLESKHDTEIQDEDYVEIVKKIEIEFFKAVEQDFFYSTYDSFSANLRMSQSNYSRSDRIGELFDEILYRPLLEDSKRQTTGMVKMWELLIDPKGASDKFKPDEHNDYRQAKAPILLLNSTLLNSGRNWRFEAVRMGDEQDKIPSQQNVDKNMRFKRADTYKAIPAEHQREFELGYAVAASAGVPGIFAPLAISDMYEGVRIQLVDGGVHDNQGVQGLIDSDCTHFIVSDATGQMNDDKTPSTRATNVLLRSQSIMEDRLREEQMYRMFTEYPGHVAYMHLRKGLAPDEVSLRYNNENLKAGVNDSPTLFQDTTMEFGVDPRVQRLLSDVRTHLDAFTEVEAYSLMLNGYKMSEQQLQILHDPFLSESDENSPFDVKWQFQHEIIEQEMANPNEPYLKQLAAAGSLSWKIFKLSKTVSFITGVVLCGILAILYVTFSAYLNDPLFELALDLPPWMQNLLNLHDQLLVVAVTPISLIIAIGIGIAVYWLDLLFLKHQIRHWLYNLIKKPYKRTIYLGLGLFTYFIMIYLAVFNKLFLRYGRIANLTAASSNDTTQKMTPPKTDSDISAT